MVSADPIIYEDFLPVSAAGIFQSNLGGLLHDMGKAVTPLEILNKPGRLTTEEMDVMRQHPLDGHRLLGWRRAERGGAGKFRCITTKKWMAAATRINWSAKYFIDVADGRGVRCLRRHQLGPSLQTRLGPGRIA
ncbi:2-oxoadipate dioxygenase/decarboxylase family protein [Xanthomonas oryzae]|uniref:HD-GYP domain-containing protein n=1 Tax=Xanthomonas oryzae TaxID=347 RepID=UPI0038709EA3